MGRGGQRVCRGWWHGGGWRRDEARRRSGGWAVQRDGMAARREDELCASGRTGCALSVFYLNRTILVEIETLRGLGASEGASKAGHPGARCVDGHTAYHTKI
jgi:hypothetical protein